MTTTTFRLEHLTGEFDRDWAARFYAHLAGTGGLFRRKGDGALWTNGELSLPTRISSVEEFIGRIADVCQFIKSFKDADDDQPVPLPYERARLLFYSDQAAHLPILTSVIVEPAVIPTGTGYMLTKPGFDPLTGVFYWLQPPSQPIVPVVGTRHLETCFSGVPFAKPEYRNNLIAWLLGAVIFDALVDPPLLVVTGNMRGIGKSKTVEACGVIITGQAQTPVDQHSEEFEKQLGAKFREGIRFIALDNVVAGSGKSYRNERLSRMLTSSFSKQVRVLGHSRSVEQQGVVFAMSANDAKLDPDLSSRALPVQLYADHSAPMTPFVLSYAKTHRREIYGELLTLAMETHESIPSDLYSQFRFRTWLNFVYPRILAHFGPLAINEAQELDDVVIELFSWGSDLPAKHKFTAKDLVDIVLQTRDTYPAMAERILAKPAQHARLIRAGKLLSSYKDKTVTLDRGVALLLTAESPRNNSEPTRYWFELK